MNCPRLVTTIAVLIAAVSLNAGNWSRWRGANNAGMSTGTAPLTWSAEENIKWVAEIPGRGHSTPIVWGDRVFVTTAVPTGTATERTSPSATGPSPRATQQRAQGSDGNAMTPAMRERLLEITGGKELSELSRAQRRQATQQLRRESRNATRRSVAGGQPAAGTQASGQGTAAGVEHRFLVLALDRKTGNQIWERSPITVAPHEGYHRRYGSFASSSPVTDGKLLYVSFGSRGVYAYNLDGDLVWKKDYGVTMRMANAFGEGVSPSLHGNTLLLVFDHQGDSFISALDKRSGEELWRRDRDERTSWSQALITEYSGRAQAIVAASGKIRSYDLETGDVIWECAGLGSNAIPAVIREGDVVYAMTGHRNPNLLAIRLGGEGDITDSDHVLWTNQRGNPYTASAVVHDGILYLVTDRGLISALDANTGEPHYQQQRLPNPYSLKSSPVGAGNRLYVATEQGDVVVVKMGPTYEALATNTIEGEFFMGSPIIVDGEIFLRGQNKLYAIGNTN
ncbi:MAG: PQQ-binding-like beta-propeller repeat protein [Bryobacterales bacterium]|nr:PQQ-binding-like beta-propeller repeat protein [Bryobacterales bacterium]